MGRRGNPCRKAVNGAAALAAILLALAAGLGCESARAAASATLTIDERTFSLVDSGSNLPGFGIPLLDTYGVSLAGGQSADFSFDYAVTLHDDGLPVDMPQGALAASVSGCVPLIIRICGPAYTGFEVAKVTFDVAYRDGRGASPFIQGITDGPSGFTLQTHGDSFAETVTQSGTIHVHVTNTSEFAHSDQFLVYGFAWVLAVAEPPPWTLVLTGLAVVLWRPRMDRRHAAVTPARCRRP